MFLDQIKEDIRWYQNKYTSIKNLEKDEWAFNFWVLDNMYYEEPELIEEKIIDYHDYGVDAYQINEDTKEIFLIQNKFYSEKTALSSDYYINTFLTQPITMLKNGTFKKSKDVQTAFNKFKDLDELVVHLDIYITNNNHVATCDEYQKDFNRKNKHYQTKIYYLDDIKDKYYGEEKKNTKNLDIEIESINKGTILNISNEDYGIDNALDARYIFVPVTNIYNIYKTAKANDYPIFDDNIREYLGNNKFNKRIYNTLLDPEDRKNFFYYNNGITMICDKLGQLKQQPGKYNRHISFTVKNPQIVNGCQTMNSIYEALSNSSVATFDEDYKNTFVMLKVLEIKDRKNQEDLFRDIVRYNNSQNGIDEKTFNANQAIFRRYQQELELNGILLLIKQSDKHQYQIKYKIATELINRSKDDFEKFGINQHTSTNDYCIKLDKLLQIINSFKNGGQVAYAKKNKMLEIGSDEYNTAIDFLTNNTTETVKELILLYLRAEQEKNNSTNGRYPISFYLIDAFSRYCCCSESKNITNELKDSDSISKIIRLLTGVTQLYTEDFYKNTGIDYNKMIKGKIDYSLMDSRYNTLKDVIK